MNNLLKTILLQLAISINLIAQVPLNSSLGNYKKLESNNSAYTFITDNGTAKVVFYSPNVVRFRVEKDNFAKTFSYAVVADPSLNNTSEINEENDKYIITTDSLTLWVYKKPLRFSFIPRMEN